MTILASDIKLVASKVMDDVDEGGGGPTAVEIVDGLSNQIFPDISETDRAGGAVNLRQVFASVQTDDVDTFLGSNIIVAKPPADPNVSITIFSTGETFDTRTEARARLEAYLTAGARFSGYLFGNHIAGQRTVTMALALTTGLPVTGETLLLNSNETAGITAQQYVRLTSITATQTTFYDPATSPATPYDMNVVTVGLSDSLRYDFTGYDVSRAGPTGSALGLGTTIRETVVADAAQYYGVVPLVAPAGVGDFTIQAESIYTHLVPSAEVETPLADVRMNQQDAALVAGTDGTLSRSFNAFTWTTTVSLHIGASVLPGSLNLTVSGGGLVTDNGGKLMRSGAQIGTIDYSNGILALSTNSFGTGGLNATVVFTPAVAATIVTSSTSIPVTTAGQRLTYVVTMNPLPTAGSLSVSFRAQGRWYELIDDGSGALRGSDSSFGVGMLNYTTGTVSLTLGALPDVGSEVMFAYSASTVAIAGSSTPTNTSDPETYTRFRKVITLNRAITPGTLHITWNDGTAKSATDSNGVLTGDATGAVNYSTGNIQFSPNTLPAVGTTINVNLTDATKVDLDVAAFTSSGSTWTGSVGTAVTPRGFAMSVAVAYPVRQYPGIDVTAESLLRVFDGGDGVLYVANVTNNLAIGTINYTTGAYALNVNTTGFKSIQSKWGQVYPDGSTSSTIVLTGSETRSLTLAIRNSPTTALAQPEWAWWTGAQAIAGKIEYSKDSGSVYSGSVTMDVLALPRDATAVPTQSSGSGSGWFVQSNYTVYWSSFSLGPDFYSVVSNAITLNPSPSTGSGTAAGTVGNTVTAGNYSTSALLISAWNTGVTSVATQGHVAASGTSGAGTTALVDEAVFRTAVAPIKNGSFSVTGTLADGTVITATADSNGVINSGTTGFFGTVDYTFGIVKLRVGTKVSAGGDGITDLSYLDIAGLTFAKSVGVQADTLRYNASAFTYLPLDANLIGVDPVRLPSDGRVPIFRAGSFAVIGESHLTTQTVTNTTVVTTGQVRLSRVTVTGHDGSVIEAGFTTDLEAGTITFSNVTGYSQPVTIDARVEDMALVSDPQINGQITFTRALTHAYSTNAYVSSALVPGNLKARVSLLFDQSSWDGTTFDDVVDGSAATGTYNDTAFPIEVTNKGASTERFALQFTSSSAYRVIGEHVGAVAVGTINTDCAPLNPATGEPYFTVRQGGWGSGWAVGNIVRINTVGALAGIWMIRTIQQGPETELDDSTTILIRGDVDRP